MVATKHKQIEGKKRCDRCQRENGPVAECSFEFKHLRVYWKAIYEAQLGKRMTLRRRATLDAREFDYRRPPSFWLDLCEECWTECSPPRDLFPMDFHNEVLVIPARSKKPVPENEAKAASIRVGGAKDGGAKKRVPRPAKTGLTP